MKRIHEIKLKEDFCDAVLSGDKPFEVRWNDRGYQKGDAIKFKPVDNAGLTIPHIIKAKEYEITYVLGGWGICEGYVVLGTKEADYE